MNLESPGDPKMEPKSSPWPPKVTSERLPKVSLKTFRKTLDFQTALDSKSEALASTRAQFSLFRGDQKMSQNGSQNGGKIAPKSYQTRSEGAFGGFLKMSRKSTPKWRPKGSPMGAQLGARIESKMGLKTRSLSGRALGRPRVDLGTILGAILSVF